MDNVINKHYKTIIVLLAVLLFFAAFDDISSFVGGIINGFNAATNN